MSSSTSGLGYLWTYSGGLKILEEVLTVSVVVFLAYSGYNTPGHLLNGFAIVALVCTALFLGLHVLYEGAVRRSRWPWHWIECGYVLISAVLFAVLSSVAVSVFTRGYIATGIVGYIVAMVYFFDTFDKYQLAVAPSQKYAWTTPNMPDLN